MRVVKPHREAPRSPHQPRRTDAALSPCALGRCFNVCLVFAAMRAPLPLMRGRRTTYRSGAMGGPWACRRRNCRGERGRRRRTENQLGTRGPCRLTRPLDSRLFPTYGRSVCVSRRTNSRRLAALCRGPRPRRPTASSVIACNCFSATLAIGRWRGFSTRASGSSSPTAATPGTRAPTPRASWRPGCRTTSRRTPGSLGRSTAGRPRRRPSRSGSRRRSSSRVPRRRRRVGRRSSMRPTRPANPPLRKRQSRRSSSRRRRRSPRQGLSPLCLRSPSRCHRPPRRRNRNPPPRTRRHRSPSRSLRPRRRLPHAYDRLQRDRRERR
jgi:hypothetical protein